jgi:hypothetical protein
MTGLPSLAAAGLELLGDSHESKSLRDPLRRCHPAGALAVQLLRLGLAGCPCVESAPGLGRGIAHAMDGSRGRDG